MDAKEIRINKVINRIADQLRLDPWSVERILSSLNDEILGAITAKWNIVEFTVKLGVLFSFLVMPKVQLDSVQSYIATIVHLALEDGNEWVKIIANILSPVLLTDKNSEIAACLNAEFGDSFSSERLDELVKQCRECGHPSFKTLEFSYLNPNPSAKADMEDKPIEHFKLSAKGESRKKAFISHPPPESPKRMQHTPSFSIQPQQSPTKTLSETGKMASFFRTDTQLQWKPRPQKSNLGPRGSSVKTIGMEEVAQITAAKGRGLVERVRPVQQPSTPTKPDMIDQVENGNQVTDEMRKEISSFVNGDFEKTEGKVVSLVVNEENKGTHLEHVVFQMNFETSQWRVTKKKRKI